MPDAVATEAHVIVRPMTRPDADALVDLVRATYGSDYVHEDIYQPDEFYAAQKRGEHISEVAVAADGTVLAHWAFTFHGPWVAESGMTITHPDHRGHGLATRLEANLLDRLDTLGVRWLMGEAVLFHTASQEIALTHWPSGAITGFRLNAFHHIEAVRGFDDGNETGRTSVAIAFGPRAEIPPREVWVAGSYAGILRHVLSATTWPREVSTAGSGPPTGKTIIESAYNAEHASATLSIDTIGADIHEAVAAARDAAIALGARYIEARLPVSSPASAFVDLVDEGFSYAAFLPEVGHESDLLLLQWLADPSIDRAHWRLINADVEALADAIVAQVATAGRPAPTA